MSQEETFVKVDSNGKEEVTTPVPADEQLPDEFKSFDFSIIGNKNFAKIYHSTYGKTEITKELASIPWIEEMIKLTNFLLPADPNKVIPVHWLIFPAAAVCYTVIRIFFVESINEDLDNIASYSEKMYDDFRSAGESIAKPLIFVPEQIIKRLNELAHDARVAYDSEISVSIREYTEVMIQLDFRYPEEEAERVRFRIKASYIHQWVLAHEIYCMKLHTLSTAVKQFIGRIETVNHVNNEAIRIANENPTKSLLEQEMLWRKAVDVKYREIKLPDELKKFEDTIYNSPDYNGKAYLTNSFNTRIFDHCLQKRIVSTGVTLLKRQYYTKEMIREIDEMKLSINKCKEQSIELKNDAEKKAIKLKQRMELLADINKRHVD